MQESLMEYITEHPRHGRRVYLQRLMMQEMLFLGTARSSKGMEAVEIGNCLWIDGIGPSIKGRG